MLQPGLTMIHVIVHTLAETCAALQAAAEAQRPLVLHSPPGAVHWLGSGYFLAMIDHARRQTPTTNSLAVLDCGAAPGLAIAALRAGAEAVRLDSAPLIQDKVADIASQLGAALFRESPIEILDLRDIDVPIAAVRSFLAR
jgi:predicted nicotinamide N-methyase